VVISAFNILTGGRFERWIDWFYLIWTGGGAILAMVAGDTPAILVNGALAAFFAWELWRNRPRRKRKPSRVTGVVRDLGHRLTVAPVPAGGPPS
jgi:hypothetical protein